MDDISKYPFLSGEDQLTIAAVIELLDDESLGIDERDNYILSILPEGAHSSYRKWRSDAETYKHVVYSDADDTEDDESSLFIYSLVDDETAPLVIEVFKNHEMAETDKMEVIQAIMEEEAFVKFLNWTQRDTFKENFLSELKPALRSMIEKKLLNEDFKNVEILLKAATEKARDNFAKWRSSATGINIPPPVSFQDSNRFPNEMNVAILSGDSEKVNDFICFLARMLVFRPHESVKFLSIKRVEWVTDYFTCYTLRSKTDGLEKVVRLFHIPLGHSINDPRFPNMIKEVHAVLEYSDRFARHCRDEELPEALEKFFEGQPKVTSYISCKESALDENDENGDGDDKHLGMKEYRTSLKKGILTGIESNLQIEKGIEVLSKEVKELFRTISRNTPISLKEERYYEEDDDEECPYEEIVYKLSRPFTFTEEENNTS